MKKTIMLVILISFAFGQTTTDITADKPTEDFDWEVLNISMIVSTVKDTNDYELWKKMFDEKGLIQVTLYEVDTYFPTILSYEIYVEECYNDSFKVHTYDTFYTTQWNNSCYEQAGSLMLGYELKLICENSEHFEYYHIKPTFEGFIEWIKRQE